MPLPPPRVPRLLMRVWDAPTRLFHAATVLLIIYSTITFRLGRMELHDLGGEVLLALLVFRLIWGVIGSDTSRLSAYLRNPLAELGGRGVDAEIGHNAAGGWIVLAMLLALAASAVTGLLALRPDAAMATWHAASFYALLVLIALHLASLIAYAASGRRDLVTLMVTGKKRLPAAMRQPRLSSPLLAVLVLAIAAGLVWAFIRFA